VEDLLVEHELTHTKQLHTIDIIFIELVVVFFWWIPFIYLLRNTAKLNHEFLADKGVCKKVERINLYQEMIFVSSKKVDTKMDHEAGTYLDTFQSLKYYENIVAIELSYAEIP